MDENEIEIPDHPNYADQIKEGLLRGATVAFATIVVTYGTEYLVKKAQQRKINKLNKLETTVETDE